MFPRPREHRLSEGPLTEEKQRDQATARCPGLSASAPHSTGWATFSVASWPLHEEETRPAKPRSQPASGSPALCSCVGRRRWEACGPLGAVLGPPWRSPGGAQLLACPCTGVHPARRAHGLPLGPQGPVGSSCVALALGKYKEVSTGIPLHKPASFSKVK